MSDVWNKIIVNQIPKNINGQEFREIFSKYGTIVDIYLSIMKKINSPTIYYHEFAIITFEKEEEAEDVRKASLEKKIKYNDEILMITQASHDFCPIENMPDVCLSEIFLRLDDIDDKLNCELVSPRWKAIAEKSWANITEIKDAPNEKEIVPRAKHYLRTVATSLWSRSGTLKFLAENCKKIEQLSVMVHHCKFPEQYDYLRTLLRNNCNLRSVDVDIDLIRFRDSIDLVSVLPNTLERFILNFREVLLLVTGPMELSRFTNLQVLILLGLKFQYVELRGIENLIKLRKLKINYSGIDHRSIERITHFTNLEHFSIPNCKISNDALAEILQNNIKLKYLDISYIGTTTDASFKYVRQLPQLQVLIMKTLVRVTDMYFNNMPLVKAVNLNDCRSITDQGVKQFLDSGNAINTMYLHGTAITKECLLIADRWTKNRNQSLIIFISYDIYREYANLQLIGNNKLHVIGWEPGESYEDPRDDDWSEFLCEDTLNL